MLFEISEGIRSLLFPPFCAACNAPLAALVEEPLCPGCRKELAFLPPDNPSLPSGLRAISPFRYRGPVKELLTGLKYRGRIALGRFLAGAMAEAVAAQAGGGCAEMVLAVPLHPTRLRERGFNQAQILAAEVGRQLGLPVRSGLLNRVRFTQPQTGLTRAQRLRNLRGAFALASGSRLPAKRFLLVDDVLTTGATTGACAALLKQAGAAEVIAVTAARD